MSATKTGVAAVKGTSFDFDVKKVGTGEKPRTVPIETVWLKAPNLPATTSRTGKIYDGEDAGSKIYPGVGRNTLPLKSNFLWGAANF